MPARYGYGQTKVRNSPAPSKEWMDILDRAMNRAMESRKKKKKNKKEKKNELE